jgi:AraC-like DNA-binding protein
MDVLSDVLAAVRLKGAIFFDVEATAPFVGETPDTETIRPRILPGAEHVIMFHLMMSGTCWAALGKGNREPVRLVAGDVIVFPHGDENVLSSTPGERGRPNMAQYRQPSNEILPFTVRHVVEGAERTRFICGFLGCDLRPFNPLLSALPDMILDRNEDKGGWVGGLFDIAIAEAYHRRAGTDTILSRLSELMFVEVVRRHIESLPDDSRGWLSGLRDRHVGEALKLIHGRPTEPWTLDGLSRAAGLSRTTFADRFAGYVGMPPMQYLARWRMQLAARQLEAPGINIAQVAANVGYESEAAFNRAFKKLMGFPPGAWRKRGAVQAVLGPAAANGMAVGA